MGIRTLAALLSFLALSPAFGQSKKQAYDLTWKLPHDRAVVYTQSLNGKLRGEFYVLSCELKGLFGANRGDDIGWRYAMRVPQKEVSIGTRWAVDDTAYTEPGSILSPLRIVGEYMFTRLREVRVGGKGSNQKERCAEIRGVLKVVKHRRGNNGELIPAGAAPAAALSTLSYIRLKDGALIIARYSLTGRIERFGTDLVSAATASVKSAGELRLQEPLLGLSLSALKARVDVAVEKGLQFLRSQQRKDGRIADKKWDSLQGGYGATSLSLLALLHSGQPVKSDVIRKGFEYVGRYRETGILSYDLAAELMAIEAKYLPLESYQDVLKYSEVDARRRLASEISKEDRERVGVAARILQECQGQHGCFGYTRTADTPNLSSLQYALLGLKSASRMGVRIPSEVWKRAFVAIEASARTSGAETSVKVTRLGGASETWSATPRVWPYYVPRPGPRTWETTTMVTAALCSVGIIRSELSRDKAWDEDLQERAAQLEAGGMAWLAEHYSLRANQPEGTWATAAMTYYHLYSLERAMVLTRVSELESHKWYVEGAALLLNWQEADGGWKGWQESPITDTCFALLFLKRAMIPVDTPSGPSVATGGGKSNGK